MTRSRVSLDRSHPGSGESEEDSSDAKSSKSPEEKTTPRGRKAQASDPEIQDMMDTKS